MSAGRSPRRTARRWLRGVLALARRRQPHGLLGPGYLHPHPDPRVAMHRRLWWAAMPSVPRGLFVLGEILLWLRWVGFDAWRASWRAAAAREATSGFFGARGRLFRQLLRPALAWCIPPMQALNFGVHAMPTSALDYVYESERSAWHASRSSGSGSLAEIALLRDKAALERRLSSAAVPIVSTLCLLERTATADFGRVEHLGIALFFKTRHGSGGRGAFAAWRHLDAWRGRTLAGRPLDRQGLDRALRDLCREDDVLVQPLLEGESGLETWLGRALTRDTPCAFVSTVRVVSRCPQDGLPTVEAAWLDVWAGADVGWLTCPVDVSSGRVVGVDDVGASRADRQAARQSLAAALGDRAVDIEGWERILQSSTAAHLACPGLWGIGWDWALCAQGPTLLEGNFDWALDRYQRRTGALLAIPDGASRKTGHPEFS